MIRRWLACLLVVMSWLLAPPARADVQWPQLKYTAIASVTKPVQVTNAADGSNRIFIVTQAGTVRIYQSGQLLATPFIDISNRVSHSAVEPGLFSVAFPPAFAGKRYFYLAYARITDGAVVVSRFTVPVATPNVADPNSEQVLLAIPHPNTIHFGGQLAFGPDGYLYISVGDGGPENDPSNNAQNTGLFLGKLLRIDTESGATPYAIPPTNPFVGVAGYLPEIWALGLRNPWRFSFDRGTGDLYLGDVGQNSLEEIDRQPAGSAGGQNYGWRILEGTLPFIVPNGFDLNTLTPPILTYPHQGSINENGYAIIGGLVCHGPIARMAGLYYYADWGTGKIWAATQTGGQWVSQLLDTVTREITSFGDDAAGNLYLTDWQAGQVLLVQEDTVTHAPTLSPGTGAYANQQTVTATCTTVGATIYYTTDGTDPTTASAVFPGAGLVLNAAATIKVKAFQPYYATSATTEGDYSFTAATPTFSPTPTTIYPEIGQDVSILTATTGASIYYTLDGSTPTTASNHYTGTIHLAVGPVTVKAIASLANYQSSAVASGNWTQPVMPVVSIYPPDGKYTGLSPVALSMTMFQGEIHYTLDGSAPSLQSPKFVAPFFVTPPVTVQAASFNYGYAPSGVSAVAMTMYLAETISGGGGVSGSGTAGYVDSSSYSTAQYRAPEGICVDAAGNIYVADTGNHAIRKASALGAVSTLAGNGAAGLVNANGASARFNSPRGICRDAAGNLYVADDGNHVIRKIDSAGNVTTYAGSGTSGTADGSATQAQFLALQGLALDAAGNLYVGSLGVIRKVDPQGNVSTFATLPDGGRAWVAITPAGRIYATDSSPTVYSVSSSGAASIYAGATSGYSDGSPSQARFSLNTAIVADSLSTLHLCDASQVRNLRTDNTVHTMLVTGLSNPHGVATAGDANLWIADTGQNRIVLATATDWDGDGIPDASEGGATPYVVGVDDRFVDSDGDGQSNAAEYLAGTDPRNPASYFKLQSVTRDSGGGVTIQWTALSSRTYEVFYSDDLQTWTFKAYSIGNSGVVTVYDTPPAGSTHRFYKVTVH